MRIAMTHAKSVLWLAGRELPITYTNFIQKIL